MADEFQKNKLQFYNQGTDQQLFGNDLLSSDLGNPLYSTVSRRLKPMFVFYVKLGTAFSGI